MARIVIVDDSLLIRFMLRQILTEAGHEVVGEAEDGTAAPSVVRECRPDLVTLDLVMPGRGGLATLRHLLALEPGLKVIVCSASLNHDKVLQAIQIGAVGFIVKPFAREGVLDAVASALGTPARERPPALPTAVVEEVEQDAERRDFVRLSTSLMVALRDSNGRSVTGMTVDISSGGMLLGADLGLLPGERVSFSLALDDGCAAPLEGCARVIRLDRAEHAALAFEAVSIADHERLNHYIHARFQA